MENTIQVNNLEKEFKGIKAVDAISFAVKKGEFFGLLGPNGAGKTTTIRTLYGFSPPTNGDIQIFGMNITHDWRQIRARIGVCQQENTLDPDLTVQQNLLIFAGYFSIPSNRARKRADQLLEFFALSNRKNDKVIELSGGMARRLILARALINKPELLILDEPTTGLDPQSRHLLWDRLESLKKEGLTAVLTTHYMEEASRLCDRLVIIDHGRILVEGRPSQLISQHAGSRVIEIEGGDDDLHRYVQAHQIEHDDLDHRMILYTSEDNDLAHAIRERFGGRKCIYRNSTLEDVFLRLTGRELRE